MKQRVTSLITTLIIGLIVAVGVGCSATQKIIKTGDPNLIYREAVRFYEAEEWSKAINLFQSAEPYYEGTMREDTLKFYLARSNFKNRNYEDAVELLDEFRRTYGRSPFVEDAEGMYTLSHYYMSPAPERDQTMTQQAIVVIDEFTSRYPNSEQIAIFKELRGDLVKKLHTKEYANAYSYYKIGRYKSSIVAFRNALKRYPNSDHREDISFYIMASAYELAHNSVLSKKEGRYLDMIDNYYTFIAEFPESEYRSQADHMLNKARRYTELAERKRAGEDIDDKTLENN